MWYTYIIMDPRTPCFRVPGCHLDHIPIYVGKGNAKRIKDTRKNDDVKQVIKEIKKAGLKPEYFVLESQTEYGAFQAEKDMIRLIGLLADRVGPLLNRNYGGTGGSSHIQETKDKLRQLAFEQFQNPEKRKRHKESFKSGRIPWNKGKVGVMPIPWNKGSHMAASTKEKICLARKKQIITKEHKLSVSEGLKKAYAEGRRTPVKFHTVRQKLECPYCKKIGGISAMKRYHFEHCKEKSKCASL